MHPGPIEVAHKGFAADIGGPPATHQVCQVLACTSAPILSDSCTKKASTEWFASYGIKPLMSSPSSAGPMSIACRPRIFILASSVFTRPMFFASRSAASSRSFDLQAIGCRLGAGHAPRERRSHSPSQLEAPKAGCRDRRSPQCPRAPRVRSRSHRGTRLHPAFCETQGPARSMATRECECRPCSGRQEPAPP